MKVFEKLVFPNGSYVPNRIAKAAMEENMADLNHAPSEELMRLSCLGKWWRRSNHYRKCNGRPPSNDWTGRRSA